MEQPLGTDSTFQMTLNDTGTVTQKTKSVENTVTAGSMYAITIDNQTITSDELERIYGEVTALKDSATEENIYSTEYLGQYLSLAGKLYFAEVDVFDLESAEVYNVSVTRRLSEGITGYEAQKVSRYGVVTGLSYGSLYIDVDSDDHSAVSLNSEIDDSKAYLMSAGVMSSFYESAVWEQLTGYESVSTISIFRKAREENIEILQIAQDNLEEQLKNLNTDNKTKQDVRNAVNSGKSVVIPMNDVTIGDWTGTGYILLDETTGAASYMISGGLNGGEVPLELQLLVLASSFASASNAALLVDVLSKSIFAAMFPVMIYAVYASIILLVSIMIVDMYVSYYDYIMSGDTDAYFHTEEMGMLLYFVAELELDASLFLYAKFVLPLLTDDENEGGSSGEDTETGGGSGEISYGKECLSSLKNTDNFTNSAVEHIFEGQINNNGKAVGYHYEGIEDTPGKIIPGTESAPNEFGVYTAAVEVNGIPKRTNNGRSSFFPKSMSPQQVVDAINEAYENLSCDQDGIYSGFTSSGMKIIFHLDGDSKISSAFPKY